MFSYNSAVTECQRMGEGYTIKKMWYGWIVVETPNLITGENKMNAQQKQSLSWSDWHDQLFAKLSAKQKEVLNRNTKTVYSFYTSGKLPEDVVAYVCGGVL